MPNIADTQKIIEALAEVPAKKRKGDSYVPDGDKKRIDFDLTAVDGEALEKLVELQFSKRENRGFDADREREIDNHAATILGAKDEDGNFRVSGQFRNDVANLTGSINEAISAVHGKEAAIA